MRLRLLVVCAVLQHYYLVSQTPEFTISGSVVGKEAGLPISKAQLVVLSTGQESWTDVDGNFKMVLRQLGPFYLEVRAKDREVQRFRLAATGTDLNLGVIYLQPDVALDKQDNLITLTEGQVLEDQGDVGTMGLLQSTRDLFSNRAAFDFGQAFFRVRGYDSKRGQVMLNGIPMNQFSNGRPEWNHWGGLNDVVRNQNFVRSLGAADEAFGGLLGTTNIDLSLPSSDREPAYPPLPPIGRIRDV